MTSEKKNASEVDRTPNNIEGPEQLAKLVGEKVGAPLCPRQPESQLYPVQAHLHSSVFIFAGDTEANPLPSYPVFPNC